MNTTPYPQLLEALHSHTLALFLGADLPREVTGLPSRADLAHEMAQRYHLDETLSLAEVAQRVSQAGNRFEFTDFIRNALDTSGKSPSAFHQGIVTLVKEHNIKTIITTAYDNLLEVAFQQAGVGFNRVVRGSDVSFIRPDRPTLINLYGDGQQPDTLVVTDRDHSQLLRDRDKEDVIDEVRRTFRRSTLLFYGYSLSDSDFKFLFDQIAESKFARLAYAVWPGLLEADVRMWRDRGIVILEEDPLGVMNASITMPSSRKVAPDVNVPAGSVASNSTSATTNETAPITNVSGGINLNSANTNIGGDAIGRDKIVSAGGHIIHAAAGAMVIIGAGENKAAGAAARPTTEPATAAAEDVDVAILTVLPEEYQAVCDQFAALRPPHGGAANIYAWQIGKVACPRLGGAYTVSVGMMGRAGTPLSALAAVDAVQRWKPRYIFFVGIAGGLTGLSKGDVVIADVIYGYEYGKIEQVFAPRNNWTYKTDLGLLTGANAYALQPRWRDRVKVQPPAATTAKVTAGEVASGDKVIDDPTNAFFAEVLKRWPKVKAVEMEGAGVGAAIEQAQALGVPVGFMMIRGISDLPRPPQADEPRGTVERDNWKPYASGTAAAFTMGWIEHGLPEMPRNDAARAANRGESST